MKRNLLVCGAVLLSAATGFMAGYKIGVHNGETMQVSSALIEQKTVEVVALFKSAGAEAALQICKDPVKIETEHGVFWLTCSLSADFYDPNADQSIEQGNEIIIPISIYTRLENGLHLLRDGYALRDTTLLVRAWRDNPSASSDARSVGGKTSKI